MTARLAVHAAHEHWRQRCLGFNALDRMMDCRERRSYRQGAAGLFVLGRDMAARAGIDRRSLADVSAPSRS